MNQIAYQNLIANALYEEGKDGNAYKLLCDKCDTWSNITPTGLVKTKDPYALNKA